MLNIIYGLENSERDALAYSRIESAVKEGKRAWILVPEQFSMFSEKDIIKRFGISAQTQIKVITFSRLCNLVFSQVGPLRMKYIDGAGKQIIAARTLRALKGRAGVLERSFKRRGFSSTMVDLISEFKRYGVSADMLGSVTDGIENTELCEKLKALSLAYKTFDDFLEAQAADAEDNLSLVLERIKDCDILSGELFIMHFRTFTPVETRVIGELMRIMDVCAVMCCDGVEKSSALFAPVAQTCKNLCEIAEEMGVSVQNPIEAKAVTGNMELDHLAENYFSPRPKTYAGSVECVNIFELASEYREVEAAADLILKLCREEGRKFSDFLVLARNTEGYNRIMPAIFASRGIDVFLDTRRSILTKPLVIMICSAIDILAYGYSYDRVMSIARSGFCRLCDDEIDMFENYLLATEPSYAMWAKESWEYCPDDYDIEVINRARSEITEFINAIENSLSGRKTAGEICSAILSALGQIQAEERTAELCNTYAEGGMPYLAEECRGVWNGTIAILSQISALMDNENITWKDFGELFKSACGGISVGLTPQTQGSVVFSQIDRFRTSNTPVVIVLGMTEGVFPLSHTAEGILSDAEREELLKSGIRLAPSASAKQHEEQLLIYSVLTAAKDKLYLFCPMNASDGKALEPSPIIKNIRTKIFPEISVYNPDTSGDILRGAEGKEAAFEVLCSLLAECGGDAEKLSSAAKEVYNYFKSDDGYAERLGRIADIMTAKEPEKISREAVEAIYGKTIMLSASKLEKYNACAFSYFMSYGLLASERERAGIEPRSTGSIQHAALYEYFSRLKAENADYAGITKEQCFADVYEIVKREATKSTELLYESSSYYKYVVTRMQGIAARCAWEVVKFYRSSLFRPMGFEIEIKSDGEIPMIAIRDNSGKKIAAVRGIIDRADVAEINGKKYISVIDYKSSKKTLDERLAEAGVNIQPLLYSDIVCNRMQASPAAMLYMQMTDPIVDAARLKDISEAEIEKATNGEITLGGWLNDDADVVAGYSRGGENGEKYTPKGRAALIGEAELKRRISVANKKIQESAIGIYEGNIKAEPYIDKNYDACRYCIFGGLCNNRNGDN